MDKTRIGVLLTHFEMIGNMMEHSSFDVLNTLILDMLIVINNLGTIKLEISVRTLPVKFA